MPDKLTDFRQLTVWQKAHGLVLDVYEITKKLPKDERGDLISLMRRAAMTIPIGIAQGFNRRNPREKERAYKTSLEAVDALRYYLILCKDVDYIKDNEEILLAVGETERMLIGLVRSARSG